jgi:hypothetical protein
MGKNKTLGYSELAIANSLAIFAAVRASSLEILERLTQEQLLNSGVHSESGSYDVRTWISNYVSHPFDHAEQIIRQIA